MKISDIKNQCSLSLEGNLFKAITITLFYTLINLLAQFFIISLKKSFSGLNLDELFLIIQILINLALLPLSYGLIVSLIKISKNEKVGYTDFINISLLNYTKIIKIFLSLFLRVILYVALCIFTLILAAIDFKNDAINILFDISFICSIVLIIGVALNYVFVLFINYDNPKKTCKEILSDSKNLIKKNKFKYILLILSFILWFIIFALFSKILTYFVDKTVNDFIVNASFSIITPAIIISQYIFYDDLNNKKVTKKEAN
ncbi:MAG: DUF975 family protein [Candidatus Scatovivens sp.]